MGWSVLLLTSMWACSPPVIEQEPPPPPPFDTHEVLDDLGEGYCFGAAVAPAGDVDGDGYDDLIVGGSVMGDCAGDTLVFLGGPEGLEESRAMVLGTGSWTASYFGAAVDGAGDLDRDGYDDLIVGSAGPGAYLFRGGLDGPEPEPWVALEKPSWHRFGRAVAGAGDVNGDGWLDVAVGGGSGDGAAVVYPGSASGPRESWEVTASTDCEQGLAGVGDANGDGFDDLLTGDHRHDYLLMGDASLGIDRERLDPSMLHAHSDEAPAYAHGGDVNGDGWPDLVSARSGHGVSVYLGSPDGFSGDWDLQLRGGDVFRNLGSAVDAGGDMDGDGLDELVAVSFRDGYSDGGVVLYSGHTDGPGAGTVIPWAMDGLDHYGPAVAFAGDVNGDGFDDLAIGSPGEERVYILHGGSDEDGDGYRFPSDCLDSDPEVNPEGYETCNGLDDDCDGVTDGADADGATAWYRDYDGDGFAAHDLREDACEAPEGYIAGSAPWDCDDRDAGIHPGAEEIPGDAIDQDCDGWDDGEPTDSGDHHPGDDSDDTGCRHTPSAPVGWSWTLLVIALAFARRRQATPLLSLLVMGCADPSGPTADDTGADDLAGVKLTTLWVSADGTTWLGGDQGRVARFAPGWGFHEEPTAGPGRRDSRITQLLPFDGELWATHDDTASRYHAGDWQASGLDVGETFEGYEGELLGIAEQSGSLWAFSELPPDNDPDCYWGCSTTYDLYQHRWDGRTWVRVHHLRVEGSPGLAAAARDDLLLTHGSTLWRWDDGALTDLSHPLTDTLEQVIGLADGGIAALSQDGTLAAGDLTGLGALSLPDGQDVDRIAGTARDDLYALAAGGLFHHDGAAWTEIPIDTAGGTAVALASDGSIHVLANDGANSLHIGDLAGVTEVWREGD